MEGRGREGEKERGHRVGRGERAREGGGERGGEWWEHNPQSSQVYETRVTQ